VVPLGHAAFTGNQRGVCSVPFPIFSDALINVHWSVHMYNCKSGDIAILTWDEEPVFSNVGKLVRVDGSPRHVQEYGLVWLITPVNYADGHLFIEGWDNDIVKHRYVGDDNIWHPDAWMRPLENPDESSEEMEREETVRESEEWALI